MVKRTVRFKEAYGSEEGFSQLASVLQELRSLPADRVGPPCRMDVLIAKPFGNRAFVLHPKEARLVPAVSQHLCQVHFVLVEIIRELSVRQSHYSVGMRVPAGPQSGT